MEKQKETKEYLVVYEVHDLTVPYKSSEVLQLPSDSTFKQAHDGIIDLYYNSKITVIDIKLLT